MRKIALMMAASSLAACQSTAGGGGCPPLVSYSKEFQKQAARELRMTRAAAPNVAQLVVDYGKMRDACRAGR